MIARCEITELTKAECAHCHPSAAPPARDDLEVVAEWVARYPGVCGWCGERINAGERIGRDQNDDYVCETCLP